MNEFICSVRRVNNGFSVRVASFEGGEEDFVYQENEDDEVDAFATFLRALNDYCGPATSRHSEKRIYINVAPGDKHPNAEEHDFWR